MLVKELSHVETVCVEDMSRTLLTFIESSPEPLVEGPGGFGVYREPCVFVELEEPLELHTVRCGVEGDAVAWGELCRSLGMLSQVNLEKVREFVESLN